MGNVQVVLAGSVVVSDYLPTAFDSNIYSAEEIEVFALFADLTRMTQVSAEGAEGCFDVPKVQLDKFAEFYSVFNAHPLVRINAL
jgi:hypothetical protein